VALATQNGEATVSPDVLTFDETSWNTAQTVTVTAVDDLDAENSGLGNDLIAFTVSSATSANYHGITVPNVIVNVADNDGGYGVFIAESGGSTAVSETGNTAVGSAGLDSYTIVLTRQPTSNVVVNLAVNAQLSVNTAPNGISFATNTTTTRTFTIENWNTPQQVSVRGQDDSTQENWHTRLSHHAAHPADRGCYHRQRQLHHDRSHRR